MVLSRSQNRLVYASFADSKATEPAPVSYYGVSSQESEETRDESSDIAEEVHKSLLVEERLFSACYQQTQTWNREKSSRRRLKIVLELLLLMRTCWSFWNLLNRSLVGILLKMVMHNGHAQVAYRAKALRTPDPYYDRRKFHLRTSIVKRKRVWSKPWLEQGKCFHKFGRRSCWSTCFSLLTFRAYLSCHGTTVDTWYCWRTFGTLHGPCEWQ